MRLGERNKRDDETLGTGGGKGGVGVLGGSTTKTGNWEYPTGLD